MKWSGIKNGKTLLTEKSKKIQLQKEDEVLFLMWLNTKVLISRKCTSTDEGLRGVTLFGSSPQSFR